MIIEITPKGSAPSKAERLQIPGQGTYSEVAQILGPVTDCRTIRDWGGDVIGWSGYTTRSVIRVLYPLTDPGNRVQVH